MLAIFVLCAGSTSTFSAERVVGVVAVHVVETFDAARVLSRTFAEERLTSLLRFFVASDAGVGGGVANSLAAMGVIQTIDTRV